MHAAFNEIALEMQGMSGLPTEQWQRASVRAARERASLSRGWLPLIFAKLQQRLAHP